MARSQSWGLAITPFAAAARRPAPATAPLDRARIFAFGGILCTVNGCATTIIGQLSSSGATAAVVSLLGVSAVVWFAIFIIERISAESGAPESASRGDLAIAAGMIAASVVPVPTLAAVALSGGGLWLLLTRKAATRARRIGLVLVALSVTLIWGRLTIALFGPSFLALDGSLVSAIAGTRHEGNLVYFVGSAQPFAIGAPCSSLHNVTLASLLWASVSALLDLRVDARWIATCLSACAAVIAVNAVRLAAIALYPAHFVSLHDGGLGQMFGAASLAAAAAVIVTALHHVRPRAAV